MSAKTRTTNQAIIEQHVVEVYGKHFHENQWGKRHAEAWTNPKPGPEKMIKSQIVALAEYADEYHRASWAEGYDEICDDGYAGQSWLSIASNVVHLLSMDLGRFDGGTLDSLIRDIVRNEGGDPDTL